MSEQAQHGIGIGTGLIHASGCMRRRGIIEGADIQENESGIAVTIKRIGMHRTPTEDKFHIPGAALTDPMTEQVVANFAIALKLGRVGERPGDNARLLMRHTAMYRGTDGHFHITGTPDDAVRPCRQPVAQAPDRHVA